jgi:hypothetical protein
MSSKASRRHGGASAGRGWIRWPAPAQAECLLRDIYGESDNEAIDRVRNAVFVIVEQFTKYLRKDLWREHHDAQNIDYVCGIGLPEGYGLSGSDHWRARKSANDLALLVPSASIRPPSASTPGSVRCRAHAPSPGTED